MNHACRNCGHAPHPPGCDAELDTTWGPESCGCGHYEKEADD